MTVTLLAWPPHGVEIRCATTRLRAVRESDFAALLALKDEGIADPELPMPFIAAWHEGPDVDCIAHWYATMANFSPQRWTLTFVVIDDGEIAGIYDLMGVDAPALRSLETASWLARRFHGRGLGTRARQMVASFAFDHLGIEEMRSGAHVGNTASRRVSEKCGYVANGTQRVPAPGGYTTDVRYLLTPETFRRPAEPIDVVGAQAFRAFVGL